MNEGPAGVRKKSHAGDNRGIPHFKKRRVGHPASHLCQLTYWMVFSQLQKNEGWAPGRILTAFLCLDAAQAVWYENGGCRPRTVNASFCLTTSPPWRSPDWRGTTSFEFC